MTCTSTMLKSNHPVMISYSMDGYWSLSALPFHQENVTMEQLDYSRIQMVFFNTFFSVSMLR